MHDVLVDLHLVGAGYHGVELHAQLVLRGGDFVVVLFDDDAHFSENRQHFGTHVLQAVDRRNREVTALDAWTVAKVAGFVIRVVVGRQFR